MCPLWATINYEGIEENLCFPGLFESTDEWNMPNSSSGNLTKRDGHTAPEVEGGVGRYGVRVKKEAIVKK